MNQKKQYTQNVILLLSDMIAVACSYLATNFFWIGLIKGYNVLQQRKNINQFGIVLIAFVVINLIFSGNKKFIRRKIFEEFLQCIKINILFAASYAIMLFIGDSFDDASRGVYVCTVIFNIFIMFALRIIIRIYLVKIYKNQKKTDHLFIITTSDYAEEVISNMKRNIEWANRISGMAIMDKDMVGSIIHNISVVAVKENVLDYIKVQIIDEVFIYMPKAENRELNGLIMELENMGVTVHLSVEMLESFKDFNKSLNILGDVPVLTFANNFYEPAKLAIKRMFDIIGALAGITITLVAGIFVAPAILIESRGPLIYKQKRVGKNGRYFYVYKFRSMYKDAEERKKAFREQNEMKELMFRMTDDPGITKVGKFIRKTGIDELPKFFNVLFGDMSLVGTKSPTVDEFKQYEGYHKRRLSMKPGMTGMWKVKGRNNIEDFEEVVKLDLEYIDNWSIGLDFKIILKTIGVVFRHGGAR